MYNYMTIKNYLFCITIIIRLFLCSFCCSQDVKELPKLSKDDRILILAAHPDDEILGVGGVIQKALENGSKTKVVCSTNGEHNEFDFIAYEKRITFRRKGFKSQ